jgi:dipeptidyl aminopeptidase/acylaminoacyl peptidase
MQMVNACIKTPAVLLLAWAGAISAQVQAQTPTAPPDPAVQFGTQQSAYGAELSPDGKRVVYIGPGPGTNNILLVVDLAARKTTAVTRSDGQPMRLRHCGWASSQRLVCEESGLVKTEAHAVAYSRMFAMDIDGKNVVALGRRDTANQLYGRQFDGSILDWLDGSDGKILMSRYYVPEMSTGTRTAQTEEGYGVDLLDTHSQKSVIVERPKPNQHYMSDGRGTVRLMTREGVARDNLLSGTFTHYYRTTGDREWRELGTDDTEGHGIEPLAVDSGVNAAYVLKTVDGRRALYRISLDGSLKSELVFAHPQVDVDGIVTIGRSGRVIGAHYDTDKPHVEYFDAAYRQLATSLAPAIPNLPLISFVSASADEKIQLIFASGDNQPGRYYILDRTSNQLAALLSARPELNDARLSQVHSVRYPAADGTMVPAYLTLPPGVEKAVGLPAIVMPHGGPAARDVWGFDWLAQYYASRGFAVLQPNFRGSAGFGNDWFVRNGFRDWKIAVGDINDGGRWLVVQGMADPAKLAIVGWSYGGYAALQANVLDPNLFKAVVAVAPVTDLQMLKDEQEGFTNALLVHDFIGSGPHIEAGSPARHAAQFKAPVMMFHGDLDANVDITESRAMDKALNRAGKKSELIVYPKLDHQLPDSTARADMLRRSYEFLRSSLKL